MGVLDQQEREIHERIVEDGFTGRIAEMGPYDSLTLPIPVDDVRIQRIKEKDKEPMFVVVEIESGWSNSKRNWPAARLVEAVNTVNSRKPVGHLGHPLLDPKAHERDFPETQVVWLGGAHTIKDGKTVAHFKGYVLPDARARVLLENDAIDGVSWFGDSTMKPVPGGYEVTSFDLETIDFARKGRSGMKSRIVSLTGEQSTKGGTTVEPKDITAISEDELRTHAPLLVKEIERKAVEPVETKIGEQTATISQLQPDVDVFTEIKRLLKITDGENVVEKVTNLIAQVEDSAKGEIKDFVKSLIAKKVKTERGQSMLSRLIGEMHTEYDGELDDAMKQKIEADFTAKVDGDDDIKAVIGEMQTSNNDNNGGGTQGGSALGGKSRTGAFRTGEGEGTDVVTHTDNLTVRKVKL